MKKIFLIFIILFNCFVGTAFIAAQFHPCDCVYLGFLNQSDQDMKVIVSDKYGSVFWGGTVRASEKPLFVKAAGYGRDTSYRVQVLENEKIISDQEYSYDVPLWGEQNFFVITNQKKISYSLWQLRSGFFGELIDVVVYGFGSFISCPLQKLGLSPKSIPSSE